MLKLVIQDDEGKTTVVPLVRDEITIGREEGNTIRLTERNVSRRHALLRRENGAVTLEDLESYNGVRVNGNPVESGVALNQSDRIQIGDYLIELREEDVERADSDQTTQRIEKLDSSELAAEGASDESDDARTGPLPAAAAAAEDAAAASEDPAAAQAAAAAPEAVPGPKAVPTPSTPKAGVSAAQPAEAAEPQAHGKLVVLSTNFAGREFVLDKPSVVIGRTDDNDVCVDHRSISRHHAKVVREDGRYAIVDLQSSNGVRVNGEEYGKVELRRGDVVDLGHVRMRYVDPGEDFVFGRDAHPVDLEAGRRRGAIWAAVAVVLIGGGAGVFALASGDGGGSPAEGTEEASAATPDESEDEPPTPAGGGDATAESTEESDDDELDRVHEHLELANEAVADDRWEDVRDEARQALELDPENERALALVDQAESELENREHYEAFQDALEAGDYREVAKTFSEIDRESVYRVKGQPEHDEMRDEYVERVERRAKLAARGGQCGQLRRIAADARSLWPEAGDAASKVPCRQRVADSETEQSTSSEEEETPDEAADDAGQSTSTTPSEADQPSVEDLVEDAQSAARTGEFGRALRLCEDALRRSRGHPEALMVCLISSCNLQNVSKAKHYMSQISGDRRIYARQICLRHGVDLE